MGIFHKPLLSDLPATRIQYQPGDRILAKVSCALSIDQEKKIERAIKKYTREDVRVLVVDVTQWEIDWRHSDQHAISKLVSSQDAQLQGIDLGVVNLDGTVVPLQSGDALLVWVPVITSNHHRYAIWDTIRQWAGSEVEVIVQCR